MIYWFVIIIGIIILSISLSNPFYKITVNKVFKTNFFLMILIRLILFIIAILIIFIGLYLESYV